jgi:hypothetical protein
MTFVFQPDDVPLYQAILGPKWVQLAPSVQRAHRAGLEVKSVGTFNVTHARGWLARWLASLIGLPPASRGIPTRLHVRRHEQFEQWDRTFGKFAFQTTQHRRGHILVERFGRLEFHFRLDVRGGGICYHQCGAAARIGSSWTPLPAWVCPRIAADEMPGETADQTRVHVTIRIPIIGALMDYQGQMRSQEAPA